MAEESASPPDPAQAPAPAPAPDPRRSQASGENRPTVASLLQRVAARALDTGIAAMLGVLVNSIDSAVFGHENHMRGAPVVAWFVLPWVVYFLYEGAQLARDGQTLGKKAVGIRVASYADGSAPGRRGWTRAAVYTLPGAVFGLGYLFWLLNVLSCIWDRPYRQCLHDRSAKTVVVTTTDRA